MEQLQTNPDIVSKPDRALTLEWIKIGTNIFLIFCILLLVFNIFMYAQETKEVIKLKQPDRLIKIYEDWTGTTCICNSNLISALP